ncbi:LysR family transcriptional regulator [Colwellia sp. 75C3]|uniref:LysR family transcriptional regulator n=1 Tax=Colwellia sp. 75C3 TaxID=888425 RepID=UPI000C33B6CC|nr:LysR family transcriptional regulator [Colwellia sp. 75C3]PKG80775.1 LysR family transcriptional regulator [Colwellia sp. 75C3]
MKKFSKRIAYYCIRNYDVEKLITIGFIDMLSLQQLKAFVMCAELGSFSAAARRLGKAQSVISQAIANLEIDLGQPLFDRNTRKPTLTEQGQKLLAHAQATVLQSQELEFAAKSLATGNESELRIVVDPALLLPQLYELLEVFCQHFPATSLILNVANSDDIPNIINKQDAQFGLMLIDGSMPAGVELGLLGQLPFYVVAHPNHPLTQVSSVTRSDLAKYRQLLVRSAEGNMPVFLPEISPKKFWSNDFEALKHMAEHNFGWCYLPAHMVEASMKSEKLVRLPVSFDIKTWTIPVDRVMPINTSKGPALQWLAEASENLFSS